MTGKEKRKTRNKKSVFVISNLPHMTYLKSDDDLHLLKGFCEEGAACFFN